jgi:polysaccharide export outer membrane protein
MATIRAHHESVSSLSQRSTGIARSRARCLPAICALAAALLFSGCETTAPAGGATQSTEVASAPTVATPEVQTLKEGDALRISFPGVPSMDSTQQVRQDGRITLPMLGEYLVTGKTTDALTKELEELYAPKLVSKEVMVTLISSSFSVYVTGAVLHPGKVQSDRPISAFEAIMNAGGFDSSRANMQAVTIIREENGQTRNYTVNLQLVLEGKSSTPFYLKRSDTVYVPEKFSWF